MSVPEKKLRFHCLVKFELDLVYFDLLNEYRRIKIVIEENRNKPELAVLRERYRVDNNADLLLAMKPHPRSIALAQAAIETAWGTSRFFRKANNLFGLRPSAAEDSRIAANGSSGNNPLWLKKYASIRESIIDYYLLLGRGQAYVAFRQMKMKTSNPYQLVMKLQHYSERKEKYVHELSSMIRSNRFHLID